MSAFVSILVFFFFFFGFFCYRWKQSLETIFLVKAKNFDMTKDQRKHQYYLIHQSSLVSSPRKMCLLYFFIIACTEFRSNEITSLKLKDTEQRGVGVWDGDWKTLANVACIKRLRSGFFLFVVVKYKESHNLSQIVPCVCLPKIPTSGAWLFIPCVLSDFIFTTFLSIPRRNITSPEIDPYYIFLNPLVI